MIESHRSSALQGAGRRAAPALSWRFVPVLRRHYLVWRKLALPSVLANIADPMITLLAFGYGLGALLPSIDGVRYIEFLAAGSICMSTMMAASFESLYSAFSRMHVQRTWDSLLNAPLTLEDIMVAEWVWAAIKGCMSGLAIIVVAFALGITHSAWLALVPLVVALLGLCFAAIGLCVNALARGYDFFAYHFTLVLTPMVFLCGVFYPLENLPGWLQSIGRALPLYAAVSLARPMVLGTAPDDVLRHVVVLAAYALGAFCIAVLLTRRRFAA